MKKFTDIGQFRETIRAIKLHHDYKGKDEQENAIYSHTSPYPTLRFRGTIKLHGTNSAVVLYKDGHYEFQSRERVLNIQSDNAGFCLAMQNTNYQNLFENIKFSDHCAIYGEWCGGNIQKGVAISGLAKMFVIFAIKIDDVFQDLESYKHLKIEEQKIYNILQFENYYLDIDFEHLEFAQNELIKITENVEKQCPVGKYFEKEGIGEGVVWQYINLNDLNERYIFKVKGEKHQNSKVKKLTTIDIEEVKSLNDFADYAVTENRLNQGIDKMRELGKDVDLKNTGEFIRWVINDVYKEENDTIVKNQLDPKKLNGYISKKAQMFWKNYVNKDFA
jgi:hypothetical protein